MRLGMPSDDMASGDGDGLQRGKYLSVMATRVDVEFYGRHCRKIYDVIFDLGNGPFRTEGPLLTNDLPLATAGHGAQSEFLGSRDAGLPEFEMDPADGHGLIEADADRVRSGFRRTPAVALLAAQGILEGMLRVF